MDRDGRVDRAALIETMVLSRYPDALPSQAAALARVWSHVLDGVVTRLLALATDRGDALHIDARAELIEEFASLNLWLCERIIRFQIAGRDINAIDATAEEASLAQPEALERIENTARRVAEAAWFKVIDKLSPSYPRPLPTTLKGGHSRQQQATRRNHYVPRATTRPWENKERQVLRLKRSPRGVVAARPIAVAQFGYEEHLYPLRLEQWFSLVEESSSDARQRLLSSRVLRPEDRYLFTAFLTVQLLRTPTFLARSARELRHLGETKSWRSTITDSLVRATLAVAFDNDEVFQQYYHLFNRHRWRILKASGDMSFPLTDNPIVILPSADAWGCLYPLSPTKCLSIGPDVASETDVPVALTDEISAPAIERINRLLISHCRRQFVVRGSEELEPWLRLARECIPPEDDTVGAQVWGSPIVQDWGALLGETHQ